MLCSILRWLWSPPTPRTALRDGLTYRFRRWPDDGEVYEARGALLVNLTTPGEDLAVFGRDLYALALPPVGSIDDLEPIR